MARADTSLPPGQGIDPNFDPTLRVGDDRRPRSFRERARAWAQWIYEDDGDDGPRRSKRRRPPARRADLTHLQPAAIALPITAALPGERPSESTEADLRHALATAEAIPTNCAHCVAIYARWVLSCRYPRSRPNPVAVA